MQKPIFGEAVLVSQLRIFLKSTSAGGTMVKPKHAWMVRAGSDDELANIVWKENVVAIG